MREHSPLPFAQLITSHSQSRSCFLAFSFTIHNGFPYRIPREKFSALDLNTGEVEELDEADRLTEFIDLWKEVIAERVIATLNSIYDFDYQRMDDRVEKVLDSPSRYRRLPGRARSISP